MCGKENPIERRRDTVLISKIANSKVYASLKPTGVNLLAHDNVQYMLLVAVGKVTMRY